MGRRIILTEEQFKSLMKNGLNEAFAKMGSKGRTSSATKLAEVFSDNQLLLQNGMSIFKQEALPELPEVISACEKNPKILKALLEDEDNEIFTDQQALEFVLYRVKGLPMRGENKYAAALSELKKGDMVQAAADRQARADANLSTGQQIIKRRAKAKQERTNDAVNSINRQENTDDMTPEDAALVKSICQGICAKMKKQFAFDGVSVYIPANTGAKASPNGGIIYGDGPSADAVKLQVSSIVKALKSKGFSVSLPRMATRKVKSSNITNTKKEVTFIFFNVSK